MIQIIAAVGNNNVIGHNGKLPWPRLPADMRHFQRATMAGVVVFGYKTWLSLPAKPLPGRTNVVLSRSQRVIPGAIVVGDVAQVLELATHEDVFIAGGQSVYEEFMPHAHKILLTRVHGDFVGDRYFPRITADWEKAGADDAVLDTVQNVIVTFQTWERKWYGTA